MLAYTVSRTMSCSMFPFYYFPAVLAFLMSFMHINLVPPLWIALAIFPAEMLLAQSICLICSFLLDRYQFKWLLFGRTFDHPFQIFFPRHLFTFSCFKPKPKTIISIFMFVYCFWPTHYNISSVRSGSLSISLSCLKQYLVIIGTYTLLNEDSMNKWNVISI